MTTTARQHTRTTDAKRDQALEAGLKITLGDEVYEVRLGDVTSSLTRELRRATGMGFNQLMGEVTTQPDVDTIAGFVWLSRRISGETVDIDDVVVTYADLLAEGFDVEVPGARGDEDPEA